MSVASFTIPKSKVDPVAVCPICKEETIRKSHIIGAHLDIHIKAGELAAEERFTTKLLMTGAEIKQKYEAFISPPPIQTKNQLIEAAETKLARHEKLFIIRDCFKRQPSGGWKQKEILDYLEILEFSKNRMKELRDLEVFTADSLMDEELDLIITDLKFERMI